MEIRRLHKQFFLQLCLQLYITARKIAFTAHQMCGQRFSKGHLCRNLMTFDAHQRLSLNAPLSPRSKAVKAVFTHLWTPVNCVSKVFLWYAFAFYQKRVKGVSKFVCDSIQRFAKGVVEDTCDAGQWFVRPAGPVQSSKKKKNLLCAFRARTSRRNFSLALPVRASRPFIAFRIFYAFPAS